MPQCPACEPACGIFHFTRMTPFSTAIPDADALLAAIDAGCTNRHSFIHGQAHWRGVAYAGLRLAMQEPLADPTVVLLFAMFHDSMRLDDGHDPLHGPRGAAYAASLHGRHFHLPDDRLRWLHEAIHDHTHGHTAKNATIACCWDADRLNLWRIGVRPMPQYLSTAAARMPEMISWAGGLEGERLSWSQIIDGYRQHVGAAE